jgi:RNA ligase (TIGR02306 family)
MSEFVVKARKISSISPIEGADSIEVAQIMGYQCVVQKDLHTVGDNVIYIPEAAVLPEKLLKITGFEGKLAGSKKNRVKAIKLRGVLSQGLVLPLYEITRNYNVSVDDILESENLMELLNIEKYIPIVPASFKGDGVALQDANRVVFDVENYKNEPHLIAHKEEIFVTEKIHGTMAACGYGPLNVGDKISDFTKDQYEHCYFASSKGMFAKGIVFPFTEENIRKNLYCKTFHDMNMFMKLEPYHREMLKPNQGIVIFGEIFGNGVQDLKYNQEIPTFKGFAVYIYEDSLSNGKFIPAAQAKEVIEEMWIPFVPIIKTMEYNPEALKYLATGNSTIDGSTHIREGVVAHSTQRFAMLKFINDDYLTRKGGTEFN